MSCRSQSKPLRSIFSHMAGVSRSVRCTRCSSGGFGGLPRGRFGSMPRTVAPIYEDSNNHCIVDLYDYNKSMNTVAESAWREKHKIRRGYNGPTPVMYCRECKGSGESLTKHCAGRQLTDAEEAAIAAGALEFAEGEWLHPCGVPAAPAPDPGELIREWVRLHRAMNKAPNQAAYEQAEVEWQAVNRKLVDFADGVPEGGNA